MPPTSSVCREFLPLAATIAASLILVLLAVAFTLSRAVLRPLSALASASREISQGRYGVRLAVTRRDEIGQLTRSFNEMSATVQEATTGLETRVRERTRELTEANRALEDSQRLISESLSYARRLQAGILPAGERARARPSRALRLLHAARRGGGRLLQLPCPCRTVSWRPSSIAPGTACRGRS